MLSVCRTTLTNSGTNKSNEIRAQIFEGSNTSFMSFHTIRVEPSPSYITNAWKLKLKGTCSLFVRNGKGF
jgi:hypothetical protein